jgi:hypothetical protein
VNDTLLSPNTMADLVRVAAVILGGASFGMGAVLIPRLKAVWAKEDLLIARTFLCVHLLVVLFVAGALAEKAGEALSWRTPIALVIFSVKLVMLAFLRSRVEGMRLQESPPSRRAADRV